MPGHSLVRSPIIASTLSLSHLSLTMTQIPVCPILTHFLLPNADQFPIQRSWRASKETRTVVQTATRVWCIVGAGKQQCKAEEMEHEWRPVRECWKVCLFVLVRAQQQEETVLGFCDLASGVGILFCFLCYVVLQRKSLVVEIDHSPLLLRIGKTVWKSVGHFCGVILHCSLHALLSHYRVSVTMVHLWNGCLVSFTIQLICVALVFPHFRNTIADFFHSPPPILLQQWWYRCSSGRKHFQHGQHGTPRATRQTIGRSVLWTCFVIRASTTGSHQSIIITLHLMLNHLMLNHLIA